MSTMPQTIVEPAESNAAGIKGKRADDVLFPSFPNSPLEGYLGDVTDDERVLAFQQLVRDGTASGDKGDVAPTWGGPGGTQGYYGVDYDRDFSAPAVGSVPNFPGSIAADNDLPTAYTPNTVSAPGADPSARTSVSPATEPSNPMPGAGGSGQTNPAATSQLISLKADGGAMVLGSYGLGRSDATPAPE